MLCCNIFLCFVGIGVVLNNATKRTAGEEELIFFQFLGVVLCVVALVTPLSVTIYH